MPKLNLSIHVNEHGLQIIALDGDPALWPLVGRLAAAASPIQQPTATVVINNMSGENTQARRQDHDAAYATLNAAAAPIRERLHLPASTSPLEVLVALATEHANKASDARSLEEQVDNIDAVLRPLVIAHDEDSPKEVANLVAALIRGAEKQDAAIRAVLEEAIGRTPDPSRSTLQLAHDLAATHAHAIR